MGDILDAVKGKILSKEEKAEAERLIKKGLEAEKNEVPKPTGQMLVTDSTLPIKKVVIQSTWPERQTSVKLNATEDFPLVDAQNKPTRVYVLSKATEEFNVNSTFGSLIVANAKNNAAYFKDLAEGVRHYNIIEMDKIEDETLAKSEKILEAMAIVNGLEHYAARAEFARVLGINTSSVGEKTVKTALVNLAMKNPTVLIDEWNSPDKEIKAIFKLIMERGNLITKRGVFYYYEQESIADTEDGVIHYLKENPRIAQSLKNRAEKTH